MTFVQYDDGNWINLETVETIEVEEVGNGAYAVAATTQYNAVELAYFENRGEACRALNRMIALASQRGCVEFEEWSE